ncbi:fucose-binding lectin II [Burkholderia cenocepacia]|uniref:fucose-binding lectin II n=1 Tax=Burkholderia cenocepacia TaxID=95486 RepID=UPI00285EC1C4|nr:fucose-binding lectin II [Burkholderia cenocepacia]MDR8047995.1 fucose-binding lectin II [Burkholderia cenocepacia]
MSDFQPFSDRNGNFKLPPNIDFRAVFFANAADRQEVKLYIGENSKTAAWTYAGNSRDEVRGKILNSGDGTLRVEVFTNGKQSATDGRLAPLSKRTWFGILVSEDGADKDYNDAIVVLQWPIG